MPSNDNVQVLMIEDSPADVEVIFQSLAKVKSSRFVLTSVETLADGIARMKEDSFDIVLLDLSLPDSVGFDGSETLVATDSSVPIVVLTGLDDEAVAVEAVQRGAQDYLVKSQIDSNLLGRSLLYAIERKRIDVELQRARDDLELRVRRRTAELQEKNRELEKVIVERERAEQLARQKQEELAHVARLNLLGEMASGIAHELNQPLTAIVAYTRSCLRRVENRLSDSNGFTEWEKLVSDLESAAAQAKRGGEIIRRLRRLVAKRESDRVATDVNECVHNALELVQQKLRQSGITLELFLAELPTVAADRIQIEQVLLNLLQNAMDATKQGSANVISIRTELRDEKIAVTVTDSGRGADVDTLRQVFEPFFTTKDDGLGLGLSISRSILEAHGGELTVSANGGGGLDFQFTLPMSDTEAVWDNAGQVSRQQESETAE